MKIENSSTKAVQFLEQMREMEIYFYLERGKLKTRSKPGAINSEIAELIKTNKRVISLYLSNQNVSIKEYLSNHCDDSTDIPLSFNQEQLWVIDNIEGGSAKYNMPQMMKLSGKLDLSALKQSFSLIIERHHILRTNYRLASKGNVGQFVNKEFDSIDIPFHDITELSDDEIQSYIADAFKTESEKCFNLDTDLMLRATLYKTSSNEFYIFITMHHIASDGASFGILVNEFSHYYQSIVNGEYPKLPPLDIQYSDYAWWQRDWLQGSVLEEQLNYWKDQLAKLPLLHNIPLDYPRPKVQGDKGGKYCATINKALTEKLKALTRESGATLFTGLHAAVSSFLSQYSGEKDIVLGSPVANRERSETESLIGFFNNTLVLRSDLSDAPDFNTILNRSKETFRDACDHIQVPFQKLVEVLKPQRSTSFNPLFQVALVLQNYDGGNLHLPDIEIGIQNTKDIAVKCDLTLNFVETDEGLSFTWIYDTELFKLDTIKGMSELFTSFFDKLVESPDSSIADIPLLTKIETDIQLVQWNDTAKNFDDNACIHHLFEKLAVEQPEHLAIRFEDETITYGKLNSRANQLARYLIEQRDVKPEELIGVYLDRSVEAFVSILAVLKAGAAYLPLDPDYPEERLIYMCDDSEVSTIITTSSLLSYTPLDFECLLCVDEDSVHEIISGYPDNNLDMAGILPGNLAYCIYTSGSTGQPKGVLLEHTGMCNLAQVQRDHFEITSESKVLQFASISFDAASWEWVMALCNGASLHICSEEHKYNAVELSKKLLNESITHATLPPAVLQTLEFSKEYNFKYLITAGDKCDESTAMQWSENYRLFNAYGPTETTVCASMTEVNQSNFGSIGGPIENFQCYVLSEKRNLLPLGAVGELYIGGVGLARGYLNQQELTESHFVLHQFENGDTKRLYRTGDLVRWADKGQLEFIGRTDHQVKIRGFRIELEEIEAVIASIDNVEQALVVPVKREDGSLAIAAYYTKHQDLAPGYIKSILQDKLPDYMVPGALMPIAQFQLTSNGKIDRESLPEAKFSTHNTEFVAPQTEVQKKLCQIWQEVLKVELVGIKDNFFDLGGHSLMVTNIIVRVQADFGVDIQVKDMFAAPSIERMAELVEVELKLKNMMAVNQDNAEEESWEI